MIRIDFSAFRWVLLWTDLLLFSLVAVTLAFILYARKREFYRLAWRQIRSRPLAMVCMGICLIYLSIALMDSVHFKERAVDDRGKGQETEAGASIYQANTLTILDHLCRGLRNRTEKTFSAPFATHQFIKETMELPEGKKVRDYPRLQFGGAGLKDPQTPGKEIVSLAIRGLFTGLGIGIILLSLAVGLFMGFNRLFSKDEIRAALRPGLKTGAFLALLALIISLVACLSTSFHVLGTDQVGQDVLYRAIKGCRVGLIVGTLTTLIATPLAILFGIMAGYFGGRIDDIVQYIYTILDSIPSILLIAAVMLIVTTALAGSEQAMMASDLRLLWLCIVLGIGSWTGLCRLLRAETLKVRENEYIQAAEAFGVNRFAIMFRHILPNVTHLVLISVILRFSGLVLAEAVLAYVGIGVDPSMESWGNMINAARSDISRDPIIWWNLLAAFIFMFGLVLPANIFGDAVRDALDPKLKTQ
jgi:peptide/nickel transport system permease protein